MTAYYIIYGILSVLLQITAEWYKNFKGSSAKFKEYYIGLSMVIGFLTIFAVWVCSFFILPWWLALVLIAAYFLVAPIIGSWLDYVSPFVVMIMYPLLTIIAAVVMSCITYRLISR